MDESSEAQADLPEWCVPGAKLVSTTSRDDRVYPDSMDRGASPFAVTVVRLTKTQVVVETDSGGEGRYRRDGSNRPYLRGHGAFDSNRYLAPITAPDVQAAIKARHLSRIAGQVEGLALKWRRDKNFEAARDIADKLVEAGVIESYTSPDTRGER